MEAAGDVATALPVPSFDGSVESLELVRAGESLHLLVGARAAEPVAATQAAKQPTTQKSRRAAGKFDLLYTRLDPPFREWTKAVRINAAEQVVTNLSRGSDAKLAVNGATLLAVWTLPGNGAMGTGPLATARSTDGGKTWSAGTTYGPKTDPAENAETKHGFRFPAIAVQGNAFHLIWIDAFDEARRLGYTRSNDDGKTWEPPTIVDPVICACCPNALAASTTRLYGLYRNQKPSDMGLAVSVDRGASFAVTPSVEKFGWEFEGCPHVGGGIALLGGASDKESLICSTWSGDKDHGGVHVTRSTDAGKSWSTPQRISETSTSRTSDIAAIGDKQVAVTWDELDGLRKVIFVATSNDGGVTWAKPLRLSETTGEGNGDHPRLATVNGRFVVTWTQTETAGAGGTGGTLKLRWREVALR